MRHRDVAAGHLPVRALAAELAHVWEATFDDVAAITTANAVRIFGLPD